jgi:hypothetical protein
MVGQLFNAPAVREISQCLDIGINALAYGNPLDFFKLLKSFWLPIDGVHKLYNKHYISVFNDGKPVDTVLKSKSQGLFCREKFVGRFRR